MTRSLITNLAYIAELFKGQYFVIRLKFDRWDNKTPISIFPAEISFKSKEEAQIYCDIKNLKLCSRKELTILDLL